MPTRVAVAPSGQPAPPPLPSTAHLPTQAPSGSSAQNDSLSVILVTAAYDNTIRFWEAWSGYCSKKINHPEHQINRLAISPDKRFLAAAGHGTVKLYDINASTSGTAGANVAPLVTFTGHTSNVTSLAWHSEAKWLVSGSEDSTVKIWDIRTSSPQRNYAHLSPVNDLVLHTNQGELVSCDQSGTIKVWDLGGDMCSHELVPEEDTPIRSVSVASDGSCLVAGNHKGVVYVWTIAPGLTFTDLQPRTKFQAHQRYLLKVLISPDTKSLATCAADATVKVWNTFGSLYDPSAAATFSPGNGPSPGSRPQEQVIAGDGSFKLEKVLSGHQRWVWDMAYSADSAYLVTTSSDHTARLWELASGTTVRQYSGHNKACVCVALNDSSS